MTEKTDLRLLYLLDHHVATTPADAAVRDTVMHAVAFARLGIVLAFIVNAGLFWAAPTLAFGLGAHSAVLSALVAFCALQAEQLARINDREQAACTCAATSNGQQSYRDAASRHAALAKMWWRAASILRAVALVFVLAALLLSACGLLVLI